MSYSKDEHKGVVKWNKGYDFIDDTPRYTFECRDPSNTNERFQVVIYTQRERKFEHDPSSLRNAYYGTVRDNDKECCDTIGPYHLIKIAKDETLNLFNEYMKLFVSDVEIENEHKWEPTMY